MPIEFKRTASSQIESLSPERTVFLFPVGPLEDHGAHLPMGLDLFQADRVCLAMGEKIESEMKGWTAVLMPVAPLGVDSNTQRLAITVRPHVLRDWLVDACLSLKRSGFRYFACYSGHLGPKQLTAIEEAGKIIARGNLLGLLGKSSLVSLSSALVSAKEVRSSPFYPDPEQHGGQTDTSLALFVAPELVDQIFKNLPTMEREPSWITRLLQRCSRKTAGYWGNPKDASSEQGEKTLNSTIQKIWSKFQLHLSGNFAPSAFRSWYSVIPSNRSFFKAWIIALCVLIVLGMWASVYLQGYG